VDRTIILWSIALFFGCSILFRGIDAAVEGSPQGVSLAIQASVLAVIVAVIVVIAKRRS